MNRKLVFPILLGFVGVLLLSCLGIWQIQRLYWKTAILKNIEQKIVAKPIELPINLVPEKDQYRAVVVSGVTQSKEIHVLTSLKTIGPGFLVINPMILPNGRIIMVDKGFIPEDQKNLSRKHGQVKIVGNLLWPNEIDSFTPDPNLEKNIWFGRDLDKMAEFLGTDPILVVARKITPPNTSLPQRVGVHLSNNHLSYATTWFSLAFVWFGMTILLVYRIKKYQV